MKSKHRHLVFLSVLSASLASRHLEAVPALSGIVFSSTTIYWTWTGTTAGDNLTLETSTGGFVATLPASPPYLDGPLPVAGTIIQRQLFDSTVMSTSPLVSMATSDNSVPITAGLPATLVGSDSLTRAALAQGAVPGNGWVSDSLDPVNKPLTTTTAALVATANGQIPSGLIAVPASFREFTATNGTPYSSTFAAAPVTIQIPYLDANNDGIVDGVTPAVSVQTLSLYTIDPASQKWIPVSGSTLNTTNKVVVANVMHFSVYGLFGVNASSTLASLKIFPIPWRPGSGGAFDDSKGIHFQNLTPTATIKIFTETGHLVREIDKQVSDQNEIIWDGTNTSGERVASGVLFYMVTDPNGEKHSGRLAIIR